MSQPSAQGYPGSEGFDWRAFALRICDAPPWKQLTFHPLAGQIHGDRQYLFDGSVTTYPWGEEGLHLVVELTRGAPEPQELQPYMQALDELPADAIVMEMGAGWAFYSIVAARRLPQARLILIEANPKLAQITRRNLELNGLTRRATLLEAAAWDQDGQELQFREAGYGSYVHRQGQYAVRSVSVDGLMQSMNLPRLDVLHLDVQGAEDRVLAGAARAMASQSIQYIFVGTHSPELHRSCRQILESAGYQTTVSLDLSQTASGDGILVCRRKSPGASDATRPERQISPS